MMGLPGSGKTTWAMRWIAAHPDYVRINNDAIRWALFRERYNPETETAIKQARVRLMREALGQGKSLVIDNCNITVPSKREIIAIAAEFGATTRVVSLLGVDVRECIRRDRLRPYPVGATVIRMFARTAGVG